MRELFIYEAEPGDWRFDTDHWGYFTRVSEEEYQELVQLDKQRKKLNQRLSKLKEKEVDRWEEIFNKKEKENEK